MGGRGSSGKANKTKTVGSAPELRIRTSYSQQELKQMQRSQLETIAREVARKNASFQGITEAEALRRFDALVSSNTTPQLRKYISKYGSYA